MENLRPYAAYIYNSNGSGTFGSNNILFSFKAESDEDAIMLAQGKENERNAGLHNRPYSLQAVCRREDIGTKKFINLPHSVLYKKSKLSLKERVENAEFKEVELVITSN